MGSKGKEGEPPLQAQLYSHLWVAVLLLSKTRGRTQQEDLGSPGSEISRCHELHLSLINATAAWNMEVVRCNSGITLKIGNKGCLSSQSLQPCNPG